MAATVPMATATGGGRWDFAPQAVAEPGRTLDRPGARRTILVMSTIYPCLWFDHEAEEAANHYVGIFPNSKVKTVTRYGDAAAQASGRPKGSVMTAEFELDGQRFLALNGGPAFKFSEAISMVVSCKDQKEIDHYWSKLSAGGEESVCGWLKDKYGLSWQVVPSALSDMLEDKDPKKVERVMAALMRMKKLDVDGLKRARDAR